MPTAAWPSEVWAAFTACCRVANADSDRKPPSCCTMISCCLWASLTLAMRPAHALPHDQGHGMGVRGREGEGGGEEHLDYLYCWT